MDEAIPMTKDEVLLLVERAERIDTGDCVIDGQRFELATENKKNIIELLRDAKKATLVFGGMIVKFGF